MNTLHRWFQGSHIIPWVAPFVVFLALTFCQGKLGPHSQFWVYGLKTVVGAWLIWNAKPFIQEIKFTISLPAIFVGVLVFLVWVGFDEFYPKLEQIGGAKSKSQINWNPFLAYPDSHLAAWFWWVVRFIGSAIVVPPIEEAFYRSFLFRYLANKDFAGVSLNRFLPMPFFVTALIFGLNHNEWLPGILCGCSYQWLVLRKGHLGDAITAHGITNALLAIYVVYKGAWQFW